MRSVEGGCVVETVGKSCARIRGQVWVTEVNGKKVKGPLTMSECPGEKEGKNNKERKEVNQ